MIDWEARRESRSKQEGDVRSSGDIDYARIIHSASFRRLQGKTQILNLGDSDFYRTRLTHSLEVAQIAGGIAKHLRRTKSDETAATKIPGRSLIQAIGCAHDLGHPPFGHGGEVALNYCMRGDGGFEGNGQTLRILSRFEKFSDCAGANLTRRTLLGVLKYPAPYSLAANPICMPLIATGPTIVRVIDRIKSKPPKCYLDSEADIVGWILEPLSSSDRSKFQHIKRHPEKHHEPTEKSFDCSIMDLADDIAYGVHDLEDAIALGLVTDESFRRNLPDTVCLHFLNTRGNPATPVDHIYDVFVDKLFGDSCSRRRCISQLVHHFIMAVEIKYGIEESSEPLLKFRAKMAQPQRGFLDALQSLILHDVIKSPSVQHLEFKGQTLVVAVFEAIQTDPKRLLPRDEFCQFEKTGGGQRVICDYVARMTDNYLLKTYDRLFSPRMGSVFDKL
jgi:dGTPase